MLIVIIIVFCIIIPNHRRIRRAIARIIAMLDSTEENRKITDQTNSVNGAEDM
ncbi:hypothetical protein FB645_002005 [Coemansia sp. IMI 203386]|nr:hypothetical protein FB645_002005 [Coemansia sp. IMI 203386]